MIAPEINEIFIVTNAILRKTGNELEINSTICFESCNKKYKISGERLSIFSIIVEI